MTSARHVCADSFGRREPTLGARGVGDQRPALGRECLPDAGGVPLEFWTPLPAIRTGGALISGFSVFGRSDSSIGVVGGSNGGIGVQGHAVAATGVGVQAHHVAGGTALEINNGAIKVGGGVRAAFRVAVAGGSNCVFPDHPLLKNDPQALVFVSPTEVFNEAFALYSSIAGQWVICFSAVSASQRNVSVLVIQQ